MSRAHRIRIYRSEEPCPAERSYAACILAPHRKPTEYRGNRPTKHFYIYLPVHWVTGETAKIAEAEAKRYISEAEEQKRKSEAAKAARRAGRHRQNLTGLKAAYSASQGQDENAHLDTAEDEASDG